MLEEVDVRMAEARKESLDFKRDVIVGAENPTTHRTQADKYIKCTLRAQSVMTQPESLTCWHCGVDTTCFVETTLHKRQCCFADSCKSG